jgi:cysteine synthase
MQMYFLSIEWRNIMFSNGIIDSIGNTPLIKLKYASEITGCTILAKAEFMNPVGSVKDRAALGIIRAAEKSGELQPGGTIVEGTGGNTGVALALIGNALGYKSVIVIPDVQAQEKKDAVRLAGAEVVEVPAAPSGSPHYYVKISGRLAKQLAKTEKNGAIWSNQFDNRANRLAHYNTTGAEIYEQTNGKIDGFICAAGTGGTLAGVAMALRERNPNIKIGLSDSWGAALYEYYKNGKLKAEGSSVTEGICQMRITGNLDGLAVDFPYRIPDIEGISQVFDLLQYEGLMVGGSSGVNVAGAIRLARELGPGHTIVTILCDSGLKYQSKLFNPTFLRTHNLPVPHWLEPKPTVQRDANWWMDAA